MSREIVKLLGSLILGWPAVKSWRSSLSLMILTGWLFSVSHLTRCTLCSSFVRALIWHINIYQRNLLHFNVCVDLCGILDWLLAFSCKMCEDASTMVCGFRSSHSRIDCIYTKTMQCMVFEVCSRWLILWILKVTNPASMYFASRSCTGKEMTWAAIVFLKNNFWFKEHIDWWVPMCLESLWCRYN